MENYPNWLNRRIYPFNTNFLDLPMGKMHYVDEGQGETIVMLHGNPDWSFSFRKLIRELHSDFRCIAPDHIGFGLSDKPADWSYLPQDHAKNFEMLVTALNLKNITLVVNDWGGPIGLSYALRHPEQVKRLVILNTWMWPVNSDWLFQGFSRLMGSALGKWLAIHQDFFVRVVVRTAIGDRKKFSPGIFTHYRKPLEHPQDRKGSWMFSKHLIESSQWLKSLWAQRDKIKDKPAFVFWGLKDLGFREKELKVWENLLTQKKIFRLKRVGHFPQEERGHRLALELKNWML